MPSTCAERLLVLPGSDRAGHTPQAGLAFGPRLLRLAPVNTVQRCTDEDEAGRWANGAQLFVLPGPLRHGGRAALTLLCACGAVYLLGALAYAARRPGSWTRPGPAPPAVCAKAWTRR